MMGGGKVAQLSSRTTALRRVKPLYWALAGLALAALLPLPINDYYRSVLWTIGIYVLLGLGLNIIVGYAGLFQLGHAAFYAIGAYTAGLLNLKLGIPILATMPVAIIVAGLTGFIISRPILHLRGDYLAIVTIAFGEILRMLLVNNVWGLTSGANGLFGIAPLEIFGFRFVSVLSNYYLVLFFVAVTIFAINRLENSRLGRAWMYVREDQTAAEAMGINTVQVKAVAFVLGSAWAGLAGVLYASRIGSISPELGSFLESVTMFSIVVLGGVGSIPGVIIGAIGMVGLPELFRFVKDWRDGFVGLAMVIMMIFRPGGILPSRRVLAEMETDEAAPSAS